MSIPQYQSDLPQAPPLDPSTTGGGAHLTPKTRAVPVVISGAVGLLLGIAGTLGAVAITSAVTTDGSDDAGTTASEPQTPPDEQNGDGSAAQPADLTEDLAYEPTVDDFDVDISVTEQSCFGSAGCNVTLRTHPEYIGTEVPSGSWEITYEITGIDDSPMIRSFELNGDEFSFDPEARVGTSSSDHEIEIEITSVAEGF